jgi:hypothetical protein
MNTPGFVKYNPNYEVILNSQLKNNQTIPKYKKDTAEHIVKISNNMGSLHPEFIKTKYKKQSGFMSQLARIHKIEGNFNIDLYKDQKYSYPEVIHKLSKTASKTDIKISKNFKVDVLDQIAIFKNNSAI